MERYLISDKQAEFFEEAYPIGNGHIGAMVYGKVNIDKLSINDDALWTGDGNQQYEVKDTKHLFERAGKLVKQGNTADAEKVIEEGFLCKNADKYLPLGHFNLCFDSVLESKEYERTLDLQEGIARVEYRSENGNHCREYFVSKEYDTLAVRIRAEKPFNLTVGFESELQTVKAVYTGGVVIEMGRCPAVENRKYVYREDTKHFVCAYEVRTIGGTKEYHNGRMYIQNAQQVEFFVKSYTNWKEISQEKGAEEFLKLPAYEEIKNAHIKYFSEMFSRNSLCLSETTDARNTVDRLKGFDGSDHGLCELLYNYGRYLVISASQPGTTAMNLQGIWNEHLMPPWGSGYTLNINTQMNYWPVYMCHLEECFEPFMKITELLAENGKATAGNLYGADGFVCHHNSDIHGYTYPVGQGNSGASKYAFWFMGSGWMACQLYEAYEYTMDVELLKEKIYPVMKEALRFYISIMSVDTSGKYILSPSTSPENLYDADGRETAIAEYTAMSQEIFEDLLRKTMNACDILGIDAGFRSEITSILQNIRKPEIGENGTICEWTKFEQETDTHHRHVSHLYFLYPGEQINVIRNPDYCEAVRKSLEKRGDGGTGWSLAWKANLWAKLFDGEHAYRLLKRQLTYVKPSAECNYEDAGGTYPNMFCAHPPFQIDGNLGITAAIVHMIVQKYDDRIYLLPALPKEWQSGNIQGVCLKGGITIDLEWNSDEYIKVCLYATIAKEVKLNWQGIEKKMTIVPNEENIEMINR